MKSRVEAILWDNDGILVDTEHLYYLATEQVLQSVGIPLSEADYLELFLRQGKGAWHLAAERGFSAAECEALRDRRNALYAQWLAEKPRLIDGVTGVLEQLHGAYTMGVVTSSRRDHFEVIHRSTGLLRFFDFVITSDDCTRVKPEPEPYLRAIARAGVPADRCVAVEDSERGLRAARAAGLRCIIVPTALTRLCAFEGAHVVLPRIGDLPAALA